MDDYPDAMIFGREAVEDVGAYLFSFCRPTSEPLVFCFLVFLVLEVGKGDGMGWKWKRKRKTNCRIDDLPGGVGETVKDEGEIEGGWVGVRNLKKVQEGEGEGEGEEDSEDDY